MQAIAPHDLTYLLQQVSNGQKDAINDIFPLVYKELHQMAHQRLRRNRVSETLNTTALVHEAYLKLIDQSQAKINNRAHFFALSSVAMRHILVDYARSRLSEKRGGGVIPLNLDGLEVAAKEQASDILALNEGIEALTKWNDRLGKLVDFKFFGGLTFEEIAIVQGISVSTAKRDWKFARGWLFQYMKAEV
jgi:RNA polymerase sigma factor (TIGR02999 family)